MKKFLYLVMTDQIEGGIVPMMRGMLWLLSQGYGFLLVLRKGLYKTGILKCRHLSIPVISVGNLTVGGVGKTPLVGFIAQALKEKGALPVILTRGYMGGNFLRGGQESDEAVMLEEKLGIPVLVGSDRAAKAEAFLKNRKADVFLLDDGFQHWHLYRDMDIAVIDVTNPWGNGYLLPRGILREPKKALSRAQICVLTKADMNKDAVEEIRKALSANHPEALIVETLHKPVLFSDLRSGDDLDLTVVRGTKICTVCGIAAPNSFIKTLVELEADIDGHFPFMDHYIYRAEDVEYVIKACQKKGTITIVTTEKDAVKLRPFITMFPSDVRVLVLKIAIAVVNGEDDFLERIYRVL